jgi:hypothetical protein
VSGRHEAGDGDAFVGDRGAAEQLAACDDNVVERVDADGGCCHDGPCRTTDIEVLATHTLTELLAGKFRDVLRVRC